MDLAEFVILGSLLLPGMLLGAAAGPAADPGARGTDNWPQWRSHSHLYCFERGQ